MYKKELKYIKIEYNDEDISYIEELCDYVNQSCENIIMFFQLKNFREKINVRLWNNITSFRKHYKQVQTVEPKMWVCGFVNNSYVEILSLNEYRKAKTHENATLNDLKYLIMHEFVHSCHRKLTSEPTYYWLGEGIAVYLSHQQDECKKKFDMTLEQVKNGGPNYVNYYTMFDYVYKTYGKNYILDLIMNFELLKRDTPRLYEETKKMYGK